MYQLKVILASTRPSRKGPAVANWILQHCHEHDRFEVELLDLKTINLPFLDEPEHPRFRKYQHEHTKAWSRIIDGADAFIIVTCEYNYGFPATLKNALDFLFQEWGDKPVGIVSYGGVAAGTRAAQMLKPVLLALNTMPLNTSINIPFFTQHIDEDGIFTSNEPLDKSAGQMLKELEKWSGILKEARLNKSK